jgi:hypothetical protein
MGFIERNLNTFVRTTWDKHYVAHKYTVQIFIKTNIVYTIFTNSGARHIYSSLTKTLFSMTCCLHNQVSGSSIPRPKDAENKLLWKVSNYLQVDTA